jgi:hypothetical protein
VAGSCKYDGEPSGSGATELVIALVTHRAGLTTRPGLGRLLLTKSYL